MTATEIQAVLAIAVVLVSWVGAAFIAGVRFGSIATRLDRVERSQELLATKEQLAGVKEDMAEIKGMFRMTLKDAP